MIRIAWLPPLLKNLLSYGAVMASAVTAVPIAQLLIRIDMSERLGWIAVGYWQAIAKLSDAYMLFVGVTIVNFLLPELSKRHNSAEALRMLLRLGGLQLGMFVIASGMIYFVRDYLLLAVYSKQFLIASNLVLPQLVGDSLKVTFLLLQYYFMSRQQMFVIFISELILGLALYTLYLVLAPAYAIVAPIYAYAGVYAALALALIALLAVTKVRAKSLTS